MATGTQNKIYSNLNFRPLHTRDCVLYERGNVAPFSVIGGETGAASVIGPNSNPGGSPDVPSVIGIYSAMSEAAQPGNIRLIDSELLLNYAGSTAIEVNPTGIDGQPTSANQNTAANSIAAIRGGITVGGTYTSPAVTSSFPSKTTATTITAGFLYGVQGKLTLGAGATLANGSNFNAALFGQLDTSAAGAAVSGLYLSALHLDMGAASSLSAGSNANVNVITATNTTSGLINSILKVIANAEYFADLDDVSTGGAHWLLTGKTASTFTTALRINIGGTAYYIPVATTWS